MRALCAFLLCCCVPLSAQQTSPAARQQDLNYIANQLPKLHPNFYFQASAADFQQAAAALSGRIATATDAEFYVGLSQLVALAGDAHTSIALNGTAAQAIGFQTFPLGLRWLDDGVFVTNAAAPYARALGAQLVAIGGVPLANVIEKLAAVIPHGNAQWVHYMAQQYLTGQQILQGLGILPAGNLSPLTFRTAAGEEFTLNLAPGSSITLTAPDPNTGLFPEYLRNLSANYRFLYSPANKLAYFKYNRCSDDPANPFATFAASALQIMDQNTVDTFVFDLRGNTGGSDSLWNPLIEGLQQRIPKLLSNPRFRVYSIIDKGTFSSGMDNAMSLKEPLPPELTQMLSPADQMRLAIQTVGEPSGGKPAEYGQVQSFTLPGSKLQGQYSTKYFPNPSYIPDLPSFLPDIPVAVQSTDYFARHDPMMATILARATAAKVVDASGAVVTVNGASFRLDSGVSPGSVATAFGNFAKVPDEVMVGGVPGRVISAAISQVNFIVPASLPAGDAAISVRAGGREVGQGTVAISATAPGLFILDAADVSQPGAVENQNYDVNSAAAPARSGSVLQIFATGCGSIDGAGASVQVFIAGLPANVLFAGIVAPGLWQINAVSPTGVTGQVPLFLVAGDRVSNAGTVYLQ